jgi:hypothetical protein
MCGMEISLITMMPWCVRKFIVQPGPFVDVQVTENGQNAPGAAV